MKIILSLFLGSVPQIWFHHVRLKHKFNTKSKRPQVMERRVFEAVTKPILPEEIPYMKFSCRDPKMAQLEEVRNILFCFVFFGVSIIPMFFP
jgi:hypothetical protein